MTLIDNDEQRLLRDSLRRMLGDRQSDDPSAAPGPEFWRDLARLGLTGLPVAPEYGGSGCGMAETAVVLQELGRAGLRTAYGPCVAVAAAVLQDAGGPPGVLSGMAAGEEIVAVAIGSGLSAFPDRAGGWRLEGSVQGIANADTATRFLIAAEGADGDGMLALLPAEAPGLVRSPGLLPCGSPMAGLTLDGVRLENGDVLAMGGTGLALRDAARGRMALALMSEALGAMDAMLALSTEHLSIRHQFGQPLARFQALQHRLADMFVEIELARSSQIDALAVWELPGATLDQRLARVASAQLQTSIAIRHSGPEAIQFHGGMGMAWEHRVGHLFKRATAIDLLLGGEDAALEHLTTAHRQA